MRAEASPSGMLTVSSILQPGQLAIGVVVDFALKRAMA
jgi:hypothetical protein